MQIQQTNNLEFLKRGMPEGTSAALAAIFAAMPNTGFKRSVDGWRIYNLSDPQLVRLPSGGTSTQQDAYLLVSPEEDGEKTCALRFSHSANQGGNYSCTAYFRMDGVLAEQQHGEDFAKGTSDLLALLAQLVKSESSLVKELNIRHIENYDPDKVEIPTRRGNEYATLINTVKLYLEAGALVTRMNPKDILPEELRIAGKDHNPTILIELRRQSVMVRDIPKRLVLGSATRPATIDLNHPITHDDVEKQLAGFRILAPYL